MGTPASALEVEIEMRAWLILLPAFAAAHVAQTFPLAEAEEPRPSPPSFEWIDSSLSHQSYDDLRNDDSYRDALETFTDPKATTSVEAWQYRIGLFTLMAERAVADSMRQRYARAANLVAWYYVWILSPPDQRAAHFAAAALPDSLGEEEYRDLLSIHRATCEDAPFLDCSNPVQWESATRSTLPDLDH
jgi:hypothetical protein